MKDELFQELLESVKQGAAMKGTLQPSRTFEFPEPEVRSEVERLWLEEAEATC